MGNPFKKTDKPFILPVSVENPYQSAAILKQVIEIIPKEQDFPRETFEAQVTSNPYISPIEYQQKTGIALNISYGNYGILEGALHRGTRQISGQIVSNKFEIKPDGLYLLNPNNPNETSKRLCNFSFTIVKLQRVKNRDGMIYREVVYQVQSEDLVDRSDEFDREKLPSIPEEDYDKICEEILKRFKECHIVPESRIIARDYIREYASIVYREFRQTHKVEEFFSYHGWEYVQNQWIYLSDARNDCKCGIVVPNVTTDQLEASWLNDYRILELGKKVYHLDGTLNDEETLKVILPFWLYLHIGYACKLFLDAGLKVQFIFLLIGKTGSLKTTLCETFAQPFNEDGMLRFESTAVALENYREQCMDQIMIVDDIFKSDSSNMRKFEAINRVFGDTTGRAKSTGKDYKENIKSKVRGGCIVTAEHDLNSQQSSALRYVSDIIEPNSINTEALSLFQQDKISAKRDKRLNKVQEIFGGWIKYLELHYSEIVHQLISFQPQHLNLAFKRHQQIYSIFCAVAKLILDWGKSTGAIDEKQYCAIYSTWQKVLANFIVRNQSTAMVAEPWQQFLVTLQQALATGTALIAINKQEFEKNGSHYVGFQKIDKDGLEYVLAPDKVMTLVRRQILDTGKELVSDSTTIMKELLEHGISKGYENQDGKGGTRKRYFKRVTLNDHLVEMLVISKDAMEKAIEKFINSQEE